MKVLYVDSSFLQGQTGNDINKPDDLTHPDRISMLMSFYYMSTISLHGSCRMKQYSSNLLSAQNTTIQIQEKIPPNKSFNVKKNTQKPSKK